MSGGERSSKGFRSFGVGTERRNGGGSLNMGRKDVGMCGVCSRVFFWGAALQWKIASREKRRGGLENSAEFLRAFSCFFSFFGGRKDSGGGRPLKAQEFKTPRRKKNPRALSFPEKDSSIE